MQIMVTYILFIASAAFSVLSIRNFMMHGKFIGRKPIRTFASVAVCLLCLIAIISGVTIFELQTIIERMV
ncbi:MAG: hypothetical protein KGV48_002755 [Alcaligenaceae bacterium]|nr:hypothetical protein [Alcaligenaceae bacterium]